MKDQACHCVLARRGWQPRKFGIAKAMEGEVRRKLFHSFAGKNEIVCRLGSAQIVGVDGLVRVQNLGEAQPYIRARRPLDAQPHDAGKILAEVVNIDAGPGLMDGFGIHGPLHANRRKILRLDHNRLRIDCQRGLPLTCIKGCRVPSGLHQARVLAFAVVDLGVQNVRRAGLPACVRRHPFHAAVDVLNAQLSQQSRRRVAVVVGLLSPLERSGVPAGPKQCSNGVLAVCKLRGHVIGLVLDPLAIVGPARRKDVVAHALAVEEHFIRAQCRGIEARRFHRLAHCKVMAQRLH